MALGIQNILGGLFRDFSPVRVIADNLELFETVQLYMPFEDRAAAQLRVNRIVLDEIELRPELS